MRWSDEITLIHAELTTNSNGFTVEKLGERTTVFANRKSVGFSEFFKAKQAGFTEQMKFDVFAVEYAGQPVAEYMGKQYRILRTYEDQKKPDELELTLSDLSERGGDANGVYG